MNKMNKKSRLEAIKVIISSQEIGNQEELLVELKNAGFKLTQATLSRDLKQLKVAKAASMNGNYVYVLPNNTMYKRSTERVPLKEMMQSNGFVSLRFSGNMAVIKTRPGYASRTAYDIDNADISQIIGTVAGDDTILIILEEGFNKEELKHDLSQVVPGVSE